MSAAPPLAGRVSLDDARAVAANTYRLAGDITPLTSERDQNFRVRSDAGKEFVLKFYAPESDRAVLDLQDQALRHVAAKHPELPVPRVITGPDGTVSSVRLGDGSTRLVRLLSWVPGRVWSEVQPRTPALVESLGVAVARLDRALAGFAHPAMRRRYHWGMQFAGDAKQHLRLISDAGKRSFVSAILERFERELLPRLSRCPAQVIHHDASDNNIIVGPDGNVAGLIDFGDLMYSHRVAGLAVACTYAMLGERRPVRSVLPLVSGYCSVTPLESGELDLLFDLIQTRLAMSVCMSAWQSSDAPDNEYLLVSQRDVWDLLQRLDSENRSLAHFAFRDACGLAPNPSAPAIVHWLETQEAAPVCRHDLRTAPTTILSLEAGSDEANHVAALPGPGAVGEHFFEVMRRSGAVVGIGRYRERRAVYRATQFQVPDSADVRDVHLGIDLTVLPGEPVFAPFDATVESFANNNVDGDFGPVIILRHVTGDGIPFWTLYGHLSLDSLSGLAAGKRIRRGEEFARVGTFPTNGNWWPHLHFQLITDTLGVGTGINGVAALGDLDVWESVSPDPNVILRIKSGAATPRQRDGADQLRRRRQHLGPSLSLSYATPLNIVRGQGQFLYDADGKAYLDLVNNVAHVGHAHPRVVAAGAEQMALLNTNTRYVIAPVVEYARRLTALFPEPLTVCFLVNSGSEANDLALRLARAHTGRRDLVVIDHAYHGNLTSLIDISPYKFNGPGGEGRPGHVTVCGLPDPYRGQHRGSDAGERFAGDLGRQIAELVAQGRAPAAFIAESAVSCGGQIILPPGYLAAAYRHVRDAGGLCIADEVQVGLGRVGSHWWGFETQGVVPDIVTLGKPLGNGHPLAAVITTPDIAASFANGMEYFNTFGGNPVSAAIGMAVLDVLQDEGLRANALAMGGAMMAGLRRLSGHHPLVGDVRGLGLFIGIELVRDRSTREPAPLETRRVVEDMKGRGVLLSIDGPDHNVLKIKPPMGITLEQVEFFLENIDQVLEANAE